MGAAARQRGDALIARQTQETADVMRRRQDIRDYEARITRGALYCPRCRSRLWPLDAAYLVDLHMCSACATQA